MNARVQIGLLSVLVFCTKIHVHGQPFDTRRVPIATVQSPGTGECPSDSVREGLRSAIHHEVIRELRNITRDGDNNYLCAGTSGWTRIAHLNMTNTSQMCPTGWTETSFSGLRMCGRISSAGYQTCVSATFSTGGIAYTQVCGRTLGYQYGDTVAFAYNSPSLNNGRTIDDYYVDGLSLTHGPNGTRVHIWTFANGLSEGERGRDACPCAPNFSGLTVPSFVGSNYFCESGAVVGRFQFHNELLWDGTGCSLPGNTCCVFNSPPYFSTQLPTSTSNNIDGRICGYQNRDSGDADTYIAFLELYIK